MSSEQRVLTTHAGSLVRPPELRALLKLQRDGSAYDEAEFERVLRDSVAEVVREQAADGIDVVSDGEFGKPILSNAYLQGRLNGVEKEPDAVASRRPPNSDAGLCPDFGSA